MAYAKNSLRFIKAMRAVDPHIKIGVVATVPGTWPSGIAPYWDPTILPVLAKNINFAVLHWYAENGFGSNSALLQNPVSITTYMDKMKAYLQEYAGANATNIQMFVDETNNSNDSNAQTISHVNAMFLARDFNDWLKNGASNVSWWDLHTSLPNFSTTTPGFGILSTGLPGQPPLNSPFPPYYGYELVHHLVAPGDSYVKAKSSQPLLASYGVTDPNGDIGLMLVNTSPTATFTTAYQGLGAYNGDPATVSFYGMNNLGVSTKSTV